MQFLQTIWGRLLAGLVAAIALVVVFAVYLLFPTFLNFSPSADNPHPQTQAEANAQDIAYLKAALHKVDRSFSPEAWVQFDNAMSRLSHNAANLDPAQLELELARAVALANNGHTNLHGVGWGLTLNSIPLRFDWFAEGLFVVEADDAHQDLLGARVLTINDRSPSRIFEKWRAYIGGPPSLALALAPHFMESPEALRAVGLGASADDVALKVQLRSGATEARVIAALPEPVNGPARVAPGEHDLRELHWPRRDLSPVRAAGDSRHWVHVLDGLKSVPMPLAHPDRFYWRQYIPEGGTIFIQLNSTMDQPGHESLQTFLNETLRDARRLGARNSIVDLRSNHGGNYVLTVDFTRDLPDALPKNGRIFILVGGETFSAGIVTAARLKYFASTRGLIIGGPMGDRAQFWAEGVSRIVLPNSHLVVGYATAYHDWEHGCSIAQIFTCYLANYFVGVAAGPLTPATRLAPSFSDYVAGRDNVIAKVLTMTRVGH